jgi:hypothetical protein
MLNEGVAVEDADGEMVAEVDADVETVASLENVEDIVLLARVSVAVPLVCEALNVDV